MKIIVACGGTGGHAFPGLAVAEELAARGHDVTVWDSGRDIESCVMKHWKGATFSTGARQLSVRNVFSILRSIMRCRKEMKRARPDALLAMGSYSSLPPVMAARSRGVKIYLHEANTVPGKAVDFLSRFATAVATSFEMTSKFLLDAKTVLTGLPVRADIVSGHSDRQQADRRQMDRFGARPKRQPERQHGSPEAGPRDARSRPPREDHAGDARGSAG